MKQHLILVLFWLLFCFLHSLFAASWFKQMVKKKWGDAFRFYRIVYNLFAFIALAAIILFLLKMPSPKMFESSLLVRIPAIFLLAAGLLVMVSCIKKYFRELIGIKSIRKEDDEVLMVNGLHSYVRHPLYLGTFLLIWSLWLIIPTLAFLLTNLVITLYTLIGIRLEEQKLLKEFGTDYEKYRREVPMILPLNLFKRRSSTGQTSK